MKKLLIAMLGSLCFGSAFAATVVYTPATVLSTDSGVYEVSAFAPTEVNYYKFDNQAYDCYYEENYPNYKTYVTTRYSGKTAVTKTVRYKTSNKDYTLNCYPND